jgi:redox-sensitive bicupin YhaK (pirin superfamily)
MSKKEYGFPQFVLGPQTDLALQGFPDHPHRGQATVTYMIEGESQHEDSEGHKGTIVAGGVQWMVAGKGIIHAEMPVHALSQPDPRGLQLWVDLPENVRLYMISPAL